MNPAVARLPRAAVARRSRRIRPGRRRPAGDANGVQCRGEARCWRCIRGGPSGEANYVSARGATSGRHCRAHGGSGVVTISASPSCPLLMGSTEPAAAMASPAPSDDDDAPDADGDDQPSPSLASSAPPAPAPEAVPAAQLSQHPVWAASRGGGAPSAGPPEAGRGRGRGRGRGSASRAPSDAGGDNLAPARFERISIAALEQDQFADADGVESAILSDDDDREEGGHDFSRIHRASDRPSKRARDGAAPSSPPDDDDGDEDDEDGRRERLRGLMGAAAFGSGMREAYRAGSEAGSSRPSEQSSTAKRNALKQAFPVKGVTCVGCALANRIGPVNRFIQANVSLMTEDALFKMAALCYVREVAEPAEREGAVVPKWAWKELRCHYTLHSTSNLVARHAMLRNLQSMRLQAEQRLVRVDNGERELDRQGADVMLKVCHYTQPNHSRSLAHTRLLSFLRFWPQKVRSASSLKHRSRARTGATKGELVGG